MSTVILLSDKEFNGNKLRALKLKIGQQTSMAESPSSSSLN